jgi:2-(1,2-epoxy-1,2-dihydrophenyl)acetyl-CoA isomerase
MQDLLYHTEGSLAFITLNRPDARNAYSEAMAESLVAALDAAASDDAVRVLVITGAGQAFSAGGDLKRMRDRAGMFDGDSATLRDRYIALIQRIPRRLALFDKPVVAAVNGPAMGAGLDLACMCDIRVAAEGATLGSTFVQVGLIPGDGGAFILGRTIGFPRALELIMTARVVGSEEALSIGLVHAVVPPDQLMAEARARAERLASLPPVAVRLAKRAAYRAWEGGLEAALELAASYQGITQRTEDHVEAVDALLNRRTPHFQGR